MMTKLKICMFIMIVLIWGPNASASDAGTPHRHVESLTQQNKQLTERVKKLELYLERENAGQSEVNDEEAPPHFLKTITKHIELGGLVEIELASSKDNITGEDTSDLSLATIEIHLDAQVFDWTSAHVLLLYEEGAEDEHLLVDEGIITLGNPEKCPFYIAAGKMYLPFGSFETNMIADPLTLEIGEMGDSALQVGVEISGFYGSIYAFNGAVNEVGDDDKIKSFGLNFGYALDTSTMGLNVGIDWLNNIGDTDGIEGALPAEIEDFVSGISLHALFTMGPINVIGEYVMALDNFTITELGYNGTGAEPFAWNFEAGFVTELMGRETTFALGVQGTDEALGLELPKTRLAGTVGMDIADHTTIAFEYCLDEDYNVSDGGTGEDQNHITLQLGVEF